MSDVKKKVWKRIFMVLFALLNIGIIVWTATSEFGNSENAANLAEVKIKWWLLIPAVLMFVVAAGAEIYKYYLLVVKTKSAPEGMDKKGIWKMSQRTVLLGRYYDNITPAAVGGQPFQIYYMLKNKMKDGYGAVIPVLGMITDQMGFLVIGLFSILVGSLTGSIWSPAVVAVGWIGLLVFAFFPIVVLLATFLPKATEEVIRAVVTALAKIKLVKHREEATEKAIANVRQYSHGIKVILGEKGLFLKTVGLGALYYAGLTMIPYFVLSAFGTGISVFASFATTAAVSAAVYFVPTPGNAGAAEGVFYSVFSILPESGYVFWAMLIWRILVYYIWLALGLVTQGLIYAEDKNLMKNWSKDVSKVEDVAVEEWDKAKARKAQKG